MSAPKPPSRRLEGIRVLVTRPRERARELCGLLEAEGAEVFALPVLELAPPDDDRALRAAAARIDRFTWVLFASPSAVEALVEAAAEVGTLETLSRMRAAVVGPATARAARSAGLNVTIEADQSTGMGLFHAVRDQLLPSDEVLLPAAQEGRRELDEALRAAGIATTRVAAYKADGRGIDAGGWEQLRRRPPDVALIGSPRTAEALLEAIGDEGRRLLTSCRWVAIGPTTATALGAVGLAPVAVAARPTGEALVEAAVAALR